MTGAGGGCAASVDICSLQIRGIDSYGHWEYAETKTNNAMGMSGDYLRRQLTSQEERP